MIRFEPKPTILGGTRRWFVTSLALVASLTISAGSAKAAAVQFAEFSQTTGTPFQFTNIAGVAGAMSFTASAQTKFNFTTATGLSTVQRDATITMSGFTNAPVLSFGSFLIQPINNPGVISIIENLTGKNLLTMVFGGAENNITGILGSTNASFAGDSNLGSVITYTSDYLTFTGNPASYLIGLPTVTPSLSVTGSILSSFVSNAQGSFSGSFVPVPAPTSVAMYGTGIVATFALSRYRRRKPALEPQNA